jgi:beta-galactosidase
MYKRLIALAMGSMLLAFSTLASAAPLDKILPYAGLDSVRLRFTLSAGEARDVELIGRILPVGSTDAKPLWEGSLGKVKLKADKEVPHESTVKGLKPKLWSPGSPNLYTLAVEARQQGKTIDTKTIRFGFRTFEAKAGKLLLNGQPIFFRGIAINPPGRGVPKDVGVSRKFAEDYVRFMRAHNVNIIRLEPESDVWFEVCDELGMMIYQGFYGGPPGHPDSPGKRAGEDSKAKTPPMDASLAAYRKQFDNYLSHPSIVTYVLSNELPYEGKRGQMWHEFLTKVHRELRDEYPVPFIGNAGYGQGREGDINDVHRYWGWYYNSHLTYYNLRNPTLFGDPEKAKTQPLTFSECVGAFTGPSGQINHTFRKQLGASLNWIGHAEDQVGESQEYQAFILQHAAESFRTMRAINPRLSGLMPFTILFRNWNGIQSFDQMGHNANADQMTASYSPVLLSWEQWTPNVYAGTSLKGLVHVVNDAEDFSDLTGGKIEYVLQDADGKAVLNGQLDVPRVKYYATHRMPFEIKLPDALKSGKYTVIGKIVVEGKPVTQNTFKVYVAAASEKAIVGSGQSFALYDPAGKTTEAIKRLGMPFDNANLSKLVAGQPLVVGEGVWDGALKKASKDLRTFVAAGGRVLVLSQPGNKFDASWLPRQIDFPKTSNNDPTYEKRQRPMRDGMHVNPARPWHPALAGIDRDQLKWWSDYTGWDQTKPGFPDIYPISNGFRLTRESDLAHTAIIANYDRGLEAIAIAEMFDGKGSVLMTSFNIVPRVGADPVADRMLRNLLTYVGSTGNHEVHPVIDQPIVWGRYPTEKGVVVEPLGGLTVNCRWQQPPTAPDAKPLPDNEGAWNTKPGEGFVPHGRRVYGPWTYTNATGIRDLSDPAQAALYKRQQKGEAGTAAINPPATELDDVDNAERPKGKASPTGTGQFWASIPAGRTHVVTKVENTDDKPAKIEMSVNGGKAESIEVQAKQSASIRCSIEGGATDVNIRFKADKTLVLLETSFE